MKVLVTGASGMLGRETALAFARRGDDVRVLQRRPSGLAGVEEVLGSITDAASVRAAVADVDTVVHLAAKVSITGPHPEYVAVNVEGTRTLLAESRAAGVGRFVMVSSPSVAHAGSALLDDGTALIDTTYVDNAVDALVAAAERAETAHGQAFVVTNGEPRTVAEVFARICQAAGVPAPTRRVPSAAAKVAGSVVERVWTWGRLPDEPPMTRFLAEQLSTAHWFDQARTREVLQWAPRVPLDEGFRRLAGGFGR